MSLSHDIAEQAAAVGWEALPPAAQHAARLCLADALAVMLAATRREPATTAFADQARSYGTGDATLLAGGTAPAPAAALANGALSHALDFEDTFDTAGLHVNAAAVPVVLALGEVAHADLGHVLTALALGGDLACRLGLSLAEDPATRGWYHPPMIGAIGATLAGAKVMGLSPERTATALSLTLVQFSLTDALKRSPASDLRAVRDAFAARAATEAVMLAARGVTGTADALGEVGGIGHLLSGSAPDPTAFADFGARFHTADLTLKLWPCCRGTHGAIALALALADQGISATDIAEGAFTLEPPDDMLFEPRADRLRPATAIAAKFSIPFCFAHSLLYGAPSISSFDEPAREDPATLDCAARTTLAQCGVGLGESARLTLRDGGVLERELPPAPRLIAGETTFDALASKFDDCLGESPARHVLRSLETAPPTLSIRALMARIAPPQPNHR